MNRRVHPAVAAVLLALVLVVPLFLAVAIWRARTENRPFEFRPPARPGVSAYELVAYDVAALRAGDWVEYDNVCDSRLDRIAHVRTRLACVAVDGDAALIESRDLLLARFYPGTVILMEASRTTGLVLRAWWGVAGGAGEAIVVEAATEALPREQELAKNRRLAVPSVDMLETPQGALECELVRLLVNSREGDGRSSRARTWFHATVPFPRRLSLAAADEEIEWESPRTVRGGVVREEYRGVTVTSEMHVSGWGRDARSTLTVVR